MAETSSPQARSGAPSPALPTQQAAEDEASSAKPGNENEEDAAEQETDTHGARYVVPEGLKIPGGMETV